ncbi:MAG TPA: hypothetical protein PLY23_07675, partial [Alphaproteobacteria bacterium]|nr:hypothetical protein [Alphaproteobacteria bacterium]HQS94575.1 hypothetical protein [Alphaproteobacteria bacterium]
MMQRILFMVLSIGISFFQIASVDAVKVLFHGREISQALEEGILKPGVSKKIESPGSIVLSEQGLSSDEMVRERYYLNSLQLYLSRLKSWCCEMATTKL